MANATPMLAAIVLDVGASHEALVDAVIASLRGDGARVAGYVQRDVARHGGCPDMYVENIETAERTSISQSLGAGSKSCRLDSQALADITGAALPRLNGSIDVLILNRFGKGEAEGRGLRALFERAIELDVPVLTCVKETYLAAWTDYAGDLATILPGTVDDALGWCRNAILSKKAQQNAQ